MPPAPLVLPGEKFDFTQTQENNVFKIDDCEIQVFVRDDGSNAENTATVARELIDVEGVNILVGTVSSGATATCRALPSKAAFRSLWLLPRRTTSPA
jgi:hypothetical protein